MITAEQARMRYDELLEASHPLLGLGGDSILEVLPYEQVADMLQDGVGRAEWEKSVKPYTEAGVKEAMGEYMPFACEKAVEHRGLSAHRSLMRFKEWLRILEDDELLKVVDDDRNFPQYGAPVLKKIREKYGFEHPDWRGLARMEEGEPCRPGCDEGCGT